MRMCEDSDSFHSQVFFVLKIVCGELIAEEPTGDLELKIYKNKINQQILKIVWWLLSYSPCPG